MAQIIISGLLKYIDQNPEVSGPGKKRHNFVRLHDIHKLSLDAESIKGYAYVGCGLIAKKGTCGLVLC